MVRNRLIVMKVEKFHNQLGRLETQESLYFSSGPEARRETNVPVGRQAGRRSSLLQRLRLFVLFVLFQLLELGPFCPFKC